MNDSYKIVSSSILYWFSQKKWFLFSVLTGIFLVSIGPPIDFVNANGEPNIAGYHSLVILLMVFISYLTTNSIPRNCIACTRIASIARGSTSRRSCFITYE